MQWRHGDGVFEAAQGFGQRLYSVNASAQLGETRVLPTARHRAPHAALRLRVSAHGADSTMTTLSVLHLVCRRVHPALEGKVLHVSGS